MHLIKPQTGITPLIAGETIKVFKHLACWLTLTLIITKTYMVFHNSQQYKETVCFKWRNVLYEWRTDFHNQPKYGTGNWNVTVSTWISVCLLAVTSICVFCVWFVTFIKLFVVIVVLFLTSVPHILQPALCSTHKYSGTHYITWHTVNKHYVQAEKTIWHAWKSTIQTQH